MTTLADQYTWSQNAGFRNQVSQAMVTAALQISAEAQSFNRNRTALAIKILAPGGVAQYLPQFAEAVAADATYGGTIAAGGASSTGTDAQLQTAVNSAWNDVANQ